MKTIILIAAAVCLLSGLYLLFVAKKSPVTASTRQLKIYGAIIAASGLIAGLNSLAK